MGLWNLCRQPDFSQGIKDYKSTPGAVLLDVRSPREYKGGHVPGSTNVPLHSIEKVDSVARSKDIPLFVYCHSGARSREAVSALKDMGYVNVKNIGGMAAYRGRLVK